MRKLNSLVVLVPFFKQPAKENTKTLRTRHERGVWKLGRLWTRDDNPTSAAHIGYHVNFTRYAILIVYSRPIGRHEVLLPSWLELWQHFFRSKLVISHVGSDKSDEEHSRLESDTKWLKNALTGWIVLWTLWTFGSLCWLLSCLNIVTLFHRTPSGNNNKNAIKLYKVPPRFELGSLDSKSRVLTITPWDLSRACDIKKQFVSRS